MALNRLFASLTITPTILTRRAIHISAVQFASKPPVEKPKPGLGKSYRRIVHFPEEYTVKPLQVTNLAGRDPVTGLYLHLLSYTFSKILNGFVN